MTVTRRGGLNAELSARLPLEHREALDSPCRRRILRSLREDGGELSAAQLRAGGCATCTLSCVIYHLGVLVESHLARRLDAGSVQGRLEHAFTANLEGQSTVIEVLEATAVADGARPEPVRA